MATTTLVCKQCNFENEPERVYCHNCGAKLDRSLLPPEATKREDPVIVQERVRKMVKPRSSLGLLWIRDFALSVLLAALLAVLIVVVLPPDGVPRPNKDAVLDAPTISDDMDVQEQAAGSHRLTYTEDQVNAFLLATIRGKADQATVFALKFERVFVRLHEDNCAITVDYSLFGGLDLYATTVHTLKFQNGVMTTDTLGGNFGRLSLGPKSMKIAERVFNPTWTVLEQDRKLISQMQAVNFHKGSVEMITRASPVH